VFWVSSLDERIDTVRQPLNTMAETFLTLGLVALFLSLLGIYGVTARRVASRLPEMTLRLMLGARRGSLLRLLLRAVFLQLLAGIIVGALASVSAFRLLAAQLFGVEAAEPHIIVDVMAVMALSSLLACILPALKTLKGYSFAALREP